MAAIENDRDIILQATSPRMTPVKIPIDRVEGLPQALKRLRINSSATTFIGSTMTNPSTITLTAQKLGGLEGSVTWTVISGTATLTSSGDVATVQGSSVVGSSVSIQARVTVDGVNYEAQTTLSKLGSLASEEQVDLTTQVTGQLASGNVSGLGALALLNKVDLNTQTVGALNGQTQVTNLGSLAYANAIAANQIGAGTLAAGVIYAGEINADNLTSGTITGRTIRTKASGARLQIHASGADSDSLVIYNSNGGANVYMSNERLYITSGQTHPIDVTAYGSSSGCRFRGSAGAGLIAGSTSGPAMRLEKTTTLPTPVEGGVCYHSTHQFIFSNGSKWFKPTWTQV